MVEFPRVHPSVLVTLAEVRRMPLRRVDRVRREEIVELLFAADAAHSPVSAFNSNV
jgi:hypothetical protein